MSKNEDYLDQLLKQLVQGKEKEDFSFEQMSQEMDETEELQIAKDKKNQRKVNKKVSGEDDFIRQFEEEMDSFHTDKLISEYELLLDQELVGQEYEPDLTERKEENIQDQVETLAEPMDQPVSEPIMEPTMEPINEVMHDEITDRQTEDNHILESETVDTIDSSFFDGLNQAMGKSEAESNKEEDVDSISEEDEKLFSNLSTQSANEQTPAKQVSLDSDEDILDLLSGLSDQGEEISDIAEMLKADENHERITDDAGELINIEKELAGLTAMTAKSEAEIEEPATEKKPKKKKKKDNSQEGDKEAGFLEKFSKHLFGDDEEEPANTNQVVLTGNETPEELEMIAGLANNLSAEDKKKEEKKQAAQLKKEEKQKAAKEKKELKEAKKAEAKAKKEAKPPKEKVVDRSPKLPRVPVILIFVMAISTMILIILATNGSGYLLTKANALDLYSQEKYVEAYSVVAGADIKEADLSVLDKTRIMSSLQEPFHAYQVEFKRKDYEMGLDSLIRGIGRYRDRQKEIAKLGITNEAMKVYNQLTDVLSTSYKMSVDEALRIYDIRKRSLYSIEIINVVQSLNFPR